MQKNVSNHIYLVTTNTLTGPGKLSSTFTFKPIQMYTCTDYSIQEIIKILKTTNILLNEKADV